MIHDDFIVDGKGAIRNYIQLHKNNNMLALWDMPDNSFDSIVTDPPYGLSFMGKKWDYDVPDVELWKQCYRVLKPGGYLLSFAGTRTQHRMCVNIEDAGFEIRDMIAWVYGSGFPKSLNISKAIDKAAGVEHPKNTLISTQAKQWDGWGTAVKPALEPITVARKPLSEKTVAANVLKWGVGGINVEGCRVGGEIRTNAPAANKSGGNSLKMSVTGMPSDAKQSIAVGRFPANLIHDGSEEIIGQMPSAARFFYCAKTSKTDRDEGLEDLEFRKAGGLSGRNDGSLGRITYSRNTHPTVKPTDLMRYLCRLVTPPGGHILDPYMGSGSTGKASIREGFNFTGIEMDGEYFDIAKRRIK